MTQTRPNARFAAIGATLAWLSLALQFYLTNTLVLSQGRSFLDSIFVFLLYFTILTNLLSAVALAAAALAPTGGLRIFLRPAVFGAIASSMALVGLVYNVILRQLWHPAGWSQVADELLHVVMPVVVIAYWWLWVPKSALRWHHALWWALYPFVYVIYALIRGAFSGVYPYPFLDVAALGYGVVFRNGIGILISFLVVTTIFIAAGRWKNRRSP